MRRSVTASITSGPRGGILKTSIDIAYALPVATVSAAVTTAPRIVIAVVIDSEKSYRYLIEEELARWGKGWDEVFCNALQSGHC